METHIFKYFKCGLNTPYNWSLVAFTFIFWCITTFGIYSASGNFAMDRFITVSICAYSLIAMILGALLNKRRNILISLGAVTFIVTFLSLVLSREFAGFTSVFGVFIFYPLGIFGFALLTKNLIGALD